MADITFSGLGSGIDTSSLIKALVEAKRQPILTLQKQSDGFQSRLTLLNDFAGKVAALRSAVSSLALQATFAAFDAASSNSDVVAAAASSNASEGNHTIAVTSLATSQTTRGDQTFAAFNTALGLSGTLGLSPTGNPAAADTITVSASDTLEGIRNKINGSGRGTGTITFSAVPAAGTTVTVDGVVYEFTSGTPSGNNVMVDISSLATAADAAAALAAAATGANQGPNSTMTAAGAVVTVGANAGGVGGNAVGLSLGNDTGNAVALSGSTVSGGGSPAYAASIVNIGTSSVPQYALIFTARKTGTAGAYAVTPGGGLGMSFTTVQEAQDASMTVDGISGITRSSNVVGDVISGVTFTLVKDTSVSGPVSVTVSKDSSSVKAKIQSFLSAYNDLRSYVGAKTKYDTVAKVGGPLMGEVAVDTVSRGLVSILGNAVSGLAGAYTNLSRVGITTQRDGTLSMDATKMDAALGTDFQGVVNLFAKNMSTGTEGVAYKIQARIDQWMTPSGGVLSARKDGLNSAIRRIAGQVAEKESAVAAYEKAMKEKYARMEQLVNRLRDQSGALSSLSSMLK